MAGGQLAGRVAIVTGAGRGIGRAIALAYAREGASVVVASRTPATVEAVAAEIVAAGGTAIGVACDVGRAADITACVDKTVKRFGALHILVNNAQGFGTEANPSPPPSMSGARIPTRRSGIIRCAPAPPPRCAS